MKTLKLVLILLIITFLCSCVSSQKCTTRSVNYNSAIIR